MLISSGNQLRLWNADTGEISNTLTNNQTPITWFAQKQDGSEIAAVVQNQSIDLINLRSGQYSSLRETDTTVKCCSYNMDGRHMMVGNSNGLLDSYDLKSNLGRKKTLRLGKTTSIDNISWNKNDRFVACGTSDGSVVLYNSVLVAFSKPMFAPSHKSFSRCLDVNFSSYTISNLASAYEDGSVVCWDTNREVANLEFLRVHEQACTAVIFSPLNNMLAISGGIDAKINMYDLTAKRIVKTIVAPKGITALDINRNGWNLCVGTVDGYLINYDMRYNNDPVSAAQVHDTVVNCVEFLRTTLDEMPSGPLSLNTSLSSSVSLVDQTTTSTTTSGKPPVSASSSTSHLSVNKHSAMSLYSPENSNHMIKPSLTKSYSSSGLIAAKSSTSSQNNSNVSASMSQTVVLSNVNENSITTNGHNNYPHYQQNGNGSIHHMNHQHHRSVPPIIENNLSFTNNSTVIASERTNELKTNGHSTKNRIDLDIYSPLNRSNPTMNGITNGIHELRPTSLADVTNENLNIGTSMTKGHSIANGVHDSAKKLTANITKRIDAEFESVERGESIKLGADTLEKFREIVRESIDEFREQLMSENFKFKSEIFKEFISLRDDMRAQIERHSVNGELVDEIHRLKEENKRLKKLF